MMVAVPQSSAISTVALFLFISLFLCSGCHHSSARLIQGATKNVVTPKMRLRSNE